jgi:hypothetical protein
MGLTFDLVDCLYAPSLRRNLLSVSYYFLMRHQLTNSSLSPKRILLIIPITVVLIEISFYKLKLIKFYVRLTKSQERLSRLVIISIEKETVVELEYNLISNFTFDKEIKNTI